MPIKKSKSNTKTDNTTWRQFNFFNSYPLQSSSDLASPPQFFSQPHSISTIVSGFGSTIVGHLDGRISLLDPSFDLIRSWSAFPAGRTHLIKPTSIKGLLISIGEESDSSTPILKIWNLRHEEKQLSTPQLLGYSKIQIGTRPHPVTALALSPNLSYLAVGLADGNVLLYRHLDQALVSAASVVQVNRPTPPLPKPKVIYTSPEPITGLGFRSPKSPSNPPHHFDPRSTDPTPPLASTHRHTCLFIVTTAKVLCYFTSGRGANLEPTVLDDLGGSIGCNEMMENGDLILADESALYVYGPEGRGACLAYEGPKARLSAWGNYIVIASPPTPTSAKNETEQTRVILFDLQNRFIAHSALFRGAVQHVWAKWGELYVLTASPEVTKLVERPLSEKLSMLYDKDMYVLATNVAKATGADASEMAEIYKRFGDHLYQKSDFEGAVQQYINTIGTVQPSIVVRKFLDAQRISNLTSYLQELHAKGVANADHTTLLLNCYTKLKDHTKLEDFIKANERASRSSGCELPFDLETAIRVCRQAGYFEPALYLAKQYRQDEEYLRIQIEDRGEWLDSIRFMRSLGPAGAEANLLRYGKTLLANLPEETTDLMIDVCSGVKLESDEPTPNSPENSTNKARASSTNADLSEPNSISTPTLADPQQINASLDARVSDEKLAPKCLPSIREFFPFFIDQPPCFIRFLETIAWNRWREKMWEDDCEGQNVAENNVEVSWPDTQLEKKNATKSSTDSIRSADGDEDREAVWGTLLELYLQTASEIEESEARMRKRALCLLRKGASDEKLRYEPTQALIVCLTHDFIPGIILLYDRLGMVEDILRFWIDRADERPEYKDEVFKTLAKYGEEHSELYPIVLRYLAHSSGRQDHPDDDSNPAADNQLEYDLEKEDYLENVLVEIEKRKIMSPIEVIEILSKSGSSVSIGTVKKYLLNQVISQKNQIKSDQELIEAYRKESVKKKQEIAEVTEKAQIFHLNKACARCLAMLDLPAVHFMCQHSFHQRCLGDQEVCMTCTEDEHHKAGEGQEAMREMMSLIRRNKTYLNNQPPSEPTLPQLLREPIRSSNGNHLFFVDEVRESDDPFAYIASSFSKGLL